MFTIKNTGSNYLAKIVRLGEPRAHSNANKLQIFTVDFNSIIVDFSYKKNDLVVYFPLESAINKEFVSFFNGFAKKELNQNKEIRGYMDNSARIRAVKLRGEPSAGFIIKFEILCEWLKHVDSVDWVENQEFDTWADVLICQKYVVPVRGNPAANREKKKVKRESKIVEGQFRVSEDTAALKRNIDKINPDDIITISYKLHGTNSSIGRVLCKKKLGWKNKLAKFFGAEIVESFYDLIFASRTVIKNGYSDKIHSSFYSEDVWELHANKIKDKIQDGVILYAEIVGQLPSGGWVQKSYDYGLPPGQSELYVYRITYTKPNGEIIEFTTPQIQRYCKKFDLKTVPIFYYGKAKDWFFHQNCPADLSTENHWHENFLAELIKKYNEKNCYICKNKVPEEGIVLTKESDFFEAYKLKSFAFLERETKELDSGEANIEDETPDEIQPEKILEEKP